MQIQAISYKPAIISFWASINTILILEGESLMLNHPQGGIVLLKWLKFWLGLY